MRNKVLSLLFLMLLVASMLNAYEHKLYVFNWTEYIDPDIVKEFEEKYDCAVIEDYFDSNESMLTKIVNSTKSYDLVCPSGDHVQILLEMDLLQKLDKDQLPNWSHLNPSILNKLHSFDNAEYYAMPYFWGVTGVLYNPAFVHFEEGKLVSWKVFGNEAYKDKLMMLDDAREVVGAALIVSGYSANDYSADALAAAEVELTAWDSNIAQYHSDAYKNDVPQGEIWIAQAYNGDALQVIREFPHLKFGLMEEGTTYWIDSFVILKNAENKEMAHKFLNFLMEPEIAARNAEWVEYPTPNLTAFANFVDEETKNNELIYITDEYLAQCHPIKYLGAKVLGIASLYESICLNSSTTSNKRRAINKAIFLAIIAGILIPVVINRRKNKGK